MKDFRSLSFWTMSKEFAVEIYKATGSFPTSEQYLTEDDYEQLNNKLTSITKMIGKYRSYL